MATNWEGGGLLQNGKSSFTPTKRDEDGRKVVAMLNGSTPSFKAVLTWGLVLLAILKGGGA